MQQYLDALKLIIDTGHTKSDRTGTGTISVFGGEQRYNLYPNVLPIVTTKKVHLPSIIHELFWFLKGDTDVKYLIENGVSIWNEWVDPKTAVYKAMTVEDLTKAILRKAPRSRLKGNKKKELIDKYKRHYKKEPVKLVAGSLNKIYGQQWRKIEDIRIVEGQPDKFIRDNYDIQGYLTVDRSLSIKEQIKTRSVWKRDIDQIENVINQLKQDPDSRRIIVSAWHVPDLDQMSLMPCHALFQFYTRELNLTERVHYANSVMNAKIKTEVKTLIETTLDKLNVPTRMLSCKLYQRSTDGFLGQPYNITSYSLLTHMLANQLNMAPGEFIWTTGDHHIYSNHVEQVKEQLTRDPKKLPTVKFKTKGKDIRDITMDDIVIENYEAHPHIAGKVAV